MLIYVNQLKVIGDDSLDKVIGTIAGWLKQLTKRHFKISELKKSDNYQIKRQMVRTFNATSAEPFLYSVLFSNPDSHVHGRQWITEIGVRIESDGILVSILLETSDISTQVTELPQSSRPKVIKYIQDNCTLASNTIGTTVWELKNTSEDFRALLANIERQERLYPLVLVSCDDNLHPLLNPENLQEQLVGLAQVVICSSAIDSWEMERELGRRYSAWGGAINIIFPIRNSSLCPRRLLIADDLIRYKQENKYLISEILSIITHTTNVRRKRNHFSPTDVRAKRQKDQREILKQRFNNLRESGDYELLLEEALDQIDDYDTTIDDLKNEHQKLIDQVEIEKMQLEDEFDKLSEREKNQKYEVDELKRRLSESHSSGNQLEADSVKILIDSLIQDPTPEDCLKIIKHLFPNRIIILDNAFMVARNSRSFKKTRKLFDLLSKLATNYIDDIQKGGDSKTKSIFGKAYSANESESVERSPKLRKLRIFNYNNKEVEMFKHLKIGVSDNIEETIRVHFYWDSTAKKIVIGYCGPHLPVSGKSH